MEARDRTTLGIALAVAVVAMIGSAYQWVAALLLLGFAFFLIVWGRAPRSTESFVGRLPCGSYWLKCLEQLDFIISPRDRAFEQHVRSIIVGYDDDHRKSLRALWITRSSSGAPHEHLSQFSAAGFIEYPKDGPGWIRPDLRYVVRRTLDELGA